MKTFPSPLRHSSPNPLLAHFLVPAPRSILFLISQLFLCSSPNWMVSLPKEITAPPPCFPLTTFRSFHCTHEKPYQYLPRTTPLHCMALTTPCPSFLFLKASILVFARLHHPESSFEVLTFPRLICGAIFLFILILPLVHNPKSNFLLFPFPVTINSLPC